MNCLSLLVTLALRAPPAHAAPNAASENSSAGSMATPVPWLQQSETSEHPEPPAQRRWYGEQIMLLDGAAILMLVSLAAVQQSESVQIALVATSVGTYTLGGPIVHWAHGELGRGLGSLGLRLGAPLVSGLLWSGLLSTGNDGEFGDIGAAIGAGLGGAAGVLTAMIVDPAALAYEDIEAQKVSRLAFPLVPSIVVTPEHQQVGAIGRF